MKNKPKKLKNHAQDLEQVIFNEEMEFKNWFPQ